jgi:PelA/Pel-15E family pectate lyase
MQRSTSPTLSSVASGRYRSRFCNTCCYAVVISSHSKITFGVLLAILLVTAIPAQAKFAKADLTVAKDGTGDVESVQAAIDRVPENNQRSFVIFIKPGTYKEQVKVPVNKPFITLLGESAEKTILTFNLSNPQVGSTSASFSTYVGANDFRAEHLTFENSFGPGAQAVALLVEADRAVFINCRFLGWQDTLYAKSGRQYYRDCYIEGHVDFIFGAAAAIFESCTIQSKEAGYVTAHMRFGDDEPTGFVFHNCRLTSPIRSQTVFLGRPWRPFARVVFINTEMGQHISADGWDNWRDPTREKTAWFAEYGSRGDGAKSEARVKWARQLSPQQVKTFDTEAFLAGSDHWNPNRRSSNWDKQNASAYKPVRWNEALKQRVEWYATDEATRIADNVLLYQRDTGGWPKNIDMAPVLTEREKSNISGQKKLTDSTIDNSATFSQLAFLAKVITAKKIERHQVSFFKGLDFLFAAQYANGGFPQFFPLRNGYYSHITYNDGAMIGVLKLMRDIAQKKPDFQFVDESRRRRAEESLQKGIECVLKTQVIVDGQRTVWAAQHDEVTFAPAAARAFEPVALVGEESVEITRFLMCMTEPSSAVVNAIEGAMQWFKKSQLTGVKWIEKADASGRTEHVLIKNEDSGPLWARFYDIATNRPIFAGRDGVIKYSVEEIEAERRNGYQWYTNSAERLLKKDYPEWLRKPIRRLHR